MASTRSQELERLEVAAASVRLDLAIAARRRSRPEEIFWSVGGVWDGRVQRYVSPPRRGRVIELNEAQTEAATAIGAWIDARREGRPRPIEILLEDARGGGKSYLLVVAIWSIAVAFPGARCLIVSPANTRRDELEAIAHEIIPRSWRTGWREKLLAYHLPNGSSIAYLGADDEDALKQGGAEVVGLNEAQLMTSGAMAHAAGAVRNRSGRPAGLLLVAANHATKARGEWLEDHNDRVDDGTLVGRVVRCAVDPKRNENVEGGVVDDIDAVVRSFRPDLADADSRGVRRRLGELAAPAFRPWPVDRQVVQPPHPPRFGHVGPPPDLGDVTLEVTRRRGRASPKVLGADFQRTFGCLGIGVRLFRRGDGKLVYHITDEIIPSGNEDALADKTIRRLGREVYIVGDSTGASQDGAHTPDARENGRTSFDILREYGLHVVPVTDPVDPRARSEGGRNPDVDDSILQLWDVCEEDRLIVDPRCAWVILCLRRCRLKRKPGGSIRLDDRNPGYSHAVDCIRYILWYFEPARGLKTERNTTLIDKVLATKGIIP